MSGEKFYSLIRQSLFGGKLSQSQVNGIKEILKACTRHGVSNRKQRAYILATAKWETAHTMKPIREYGGSTKSYAPFFGRGFVQLTHKFNYRRMGNLLGYDLVKTPDLALRTSLAADILVIGMRDGLFDRKNGRPLSYYLNSQLTDWLNARRTVNIMDKAHTIAAIARKFDTALVSSPTISTGSATTGLIPVLIIAVLAGAFAVAKILGVF